jgi:hypothetical protein
MKNLIFSCILLLFFTACQDKDSDIDIKNLSGYWEIVQAQNPYGKNVVYPVNTQVDYFEVKDSVGFRKKMKPDLNGNYTTSKALEQFKLKSEHDSIKIEYTTPYDTWTEVILELNDSILLIKNNKDFLYTYKKFKPITISN